MARIFVSYRRDDAAFVAPLLAQRLRGAYGEDAVFIDIDAIPLGTDYRTPIGAAIARCDLLLVLVGRAFDGGPGAGGGRRIDDPADPLRIEVEAALQRGIPVVPVLLNGTPIPAAGTLPPALQPLAFRNAAELRAGPDMEAHLERIVRGIAPWLRPGQPPAAPVPARVPPPPSAAVAPAGPATPAPATAPAPASPFADVGELRFERDRGWGGRAFAMRIVIDGQPVGALRSGESLVHRVPAGPHRVEVLHAGAVTDFRETVQLAPGQVRSWLLSLAWTGVKLTER
jgi:hypothetical protein